MNRIEGPTEDSESGANPSGHSHDRTREDSAITGDRANSQRHRSRRLRGYLARLLLRAHVSPNTVTVAGTVGVVVGAAVFASRGDLLIATLVVGISSLADLVDGELARLGNRTSIFGALLDSTLDRVADGVIFASLAYWLFGTGEERAGIAALLCLIGGGLVPYARARAEGLGLQGATGIAPRFVRLKIVGVGGLLGGFGVPFGLEVTLWLVGGLSVVTTWQRLAFARRQIMAADADLG